MVNCKHSVCRVLVDEGVGVELLAKFSARAVLDFGCGRYPAFCKSGSGQNLPGFEIFAGFGKLSFNNYTNLNDLYMQNLFPTTGCRLCNMYLKFKLLMTNYMVI